jgi:error-prone DNA polymerase
MGFYAPAQIIDDAKRHGVEVRPVDINVSDWENTLEAFDLRLGLCNIKGLQQSEAEWIVACRGKGYDDIAQLAKRSGISQSTLDRLSLADAFCSIQTNRRQALWSTKGLDIKPLPLFAEHIATESEPTLPNMSEFEQVTLDYHTLSFSLRRHPVSFLRERFAKIGHVQNAVLKSLPNKSKVKISGLVIIRQRPGTAKGVIFQTIEDETGFANIVIWPHVFEQFREETLACPFIAIEGIVEKQGDVIHVIAKRLRDLSHQLRDIEAKSRDFH